jgi:DNA processing protein
MTRRTITPTDPEWPERLRDMAPLDPPKSLRLDGLPLDVPDRTIAIVGTRYPSASGAEITGSLTIGLVEAGFTIVSGLAVGIDSIAHRTALQVGGYTVAVLGCGLNIDYPKRNSGLRAQIERSGTVLTEYADDVKPTPYSFARRNRIVAALCAGVVFIEGGERSGGKITARLALDAGRHVFAVPGNVRSPMGVGPNDLIRRSEATLVTNVQDVLDELAPGLIWANGLDKEEVPQMAGVDGLERSVLRFLEDHPVRPERLRRGLDLSMGQAALALARLEARGWATRKQGGFALSDSGARVRALVDEIS